MSAPLTIVIPAAGASRRMLGRDKLLEDIDGEPLLRRVAYRSVQVAPVRVVLGPGQEERRAALNGLDLEIVVALDAAEGMAASLRTGVAGAPGAVMIVLPDMPDVRAEDIALMAALWSAGAGRILRAADRSGTPGHPVIFPPECHWAFAKLSGDKGAGAILEAHAAQVVYVPIGPQALRDLDTPQAWAAWRAARS
ncbi:MAG: nucleotidyltransferase family protein [Pseudomonadota bacterium]